MTEAIRSWISTVAFWVLLVTFVWIAFQIWTQDVYKPEKPSAPPPKTKPDA